MKKSTTIAGLLHALKKPLIIMKLSMILIVFCSFHSFAGASAQTITLNADNKEIVKVLSAIEKQGDFRFVYNSSLKELKQKVSVSFNNVLIKDALKQLFNGTTLTYVELENNLVAIRSNNIEVTDIIVTGKITNSNGEPVPGVSVRVKGATSGTSSTTDGSYSLNVPDGATLLFSSVGYADEEVIVGGRTNINVVLKSAVKLIEEVVVVGYGTQKRRDVTGAVASVKGADIAREPVQTATQAIQGKIAGVQILASGEPNVLPTVRLRGTGTLLGGANPLYVVDGVLTDDIRNINNADIVTLDVLKDASSSAIYGVRGANGVIIITTKKGRPGKTVFNYTANVGVREATNLVNMAGEQQYAGYLNEANRYYGSGTDLIPVSKLKGANTDWYDAILRRAFQQNHNLSLSGGSEKIVYFLSGGFLSEDGILQKNKYNRFTLRNNNEYTLSKILKLNSTLSYTRGDGDGANFGAFSNAYRAAPYVVAKEGNLYGNTSLAGNVGNPLVDIDKNYNNVLGNRVQGNFGLDLKPIAGLTLRSAINFDLDFTKSTSYNYKYLSDASTFTEVGGNQAQANSTLSISKNDATRLIWDNTATYTKAIKKSSFTVLAGFVADKFKFNSITGTAKDVPENKDQWYLDAGTGGTQTVENNGSKRTRLSYLGRINYSYDNRYLVTASYRADGSSNFGSGQRYGYFPSAAIGWVITNEAFMADQKIISNLKFRASYGQKANDNIDPGLYVATAQQNLPYYYGGTVFQGIAFGEIVDKNLKWETTDEYDFGLDFSILKNKLSGTFDYYNKKTNDALIYVTLPGILGDPDSKYLTNATTISNKGVELGITWADKIGKNWSYSVSGNAARNKNNIEKLNGGQPLFSDAVNNYTITKTDNGRPIASYFLREAIGIFQNEAQIANSAQKDAKPGDLIYRDISGPQGKADGIIDDYDRDYFGSYQPKMTYGFNGNAAYKNFDMSFAMYGTMGSKIYNGKKALRGANQQTDNLEASVVENRWTPNHTNTNVPRATAGSLPASTYFLESADFLRLNNITFGFSLPKNTVAKGRITNLRVYVTAQNLFTVTPYTGFTPEIQAADGKSTTLNQGIDINSYPSTRTYALGVNVGF